MTHKKLFIFYTILCTGLVYFAADIYLPALPQMIHFFGVNITALQTTLSMYFLGVALAQFCIGPVIDRFGYRPLAIAAGILFILSSLCCALSTHLLSLIIFRFMQAISAGSITLIARASLPRLFSKEEVASLYLIVAPALSLSPAIAPVIGGHLVAMFNWEMVFIFLSLLGILILVLTLKLQKLGKSNDQNISIHHKYILHTYASFFKNKEYVALIFILASTFFTYFAFIAQSPFMLHKLGYSEVQIGYCYISFSFAFLIATQIRRLAFPQASIKKTIVTGMIINIVSLILLLIVAIEGTQSAFMLLMPITLLSFGNGLTNPASIASASSMSQTHAGYTTSLASSMMLLASALASNIIQPITHGSVLGLAAICLAVLVVGFGFYGRLTRL